MYDIELSSSFLLKLIMVWFSNLGCYWQQLQSLVKLLLLELVVHSPMETQTQHTEFQTDHSHSHQTSAYTKSDPKLNNEIKLMRSHKINDHTYTLQLFMFGNVVHTGVIVKGVNDEKHSSCYGAIHKFTSNSDLTRKTITDTDILNIMSTYMYDRIE